MIRQHPPARIGAGHLPGRGRHGFRRCGERAEWCDMRRPIWFSIFPRDFFHLIAPAVGLLMTPDRTAPGRTHDIAEPMRPFSFFAWRDQTGEAWGNDTGRQRLTIWGWKETAHGREYEAPPSTDGCPTARVGGPRRPDLTTSGLAVWLLPSACRIAVLHLLYNSLFILNLFSI